MKNELLPEQLKIEKANEKDWNEITYLLKEAGLFPYIGKDENFKKFYVIKSSEIKNVICCFTLDIENNIAILKSYAVKNEFRGKGIGKNVAKRLPELGKNLNLRKIYAASWEAGNFWKKSGFKEVDLNKLLDTYFLKYAEHLEKNYPQFSEKTRYFILTLI
ncbi:MAG: hypothetical protein A3I68_06745 [Candidatus Melainabacteria bacterium RIFCSPLOWO2_02_FULL_35_15]|nr:MAG: hypothetical protein A3F80_04245 [Candidatus Melainabacteria bacterium RIFCSPLOWO2_12_FULL_35_11]OGI13494.1 MAG: hypothetical protein A3I68_06745 [Candidatus Melainabacteria bacterium RIFCSPLOWO2_02_FULL_35_15]